MTGVAIGQHGKQVADTVARWRTGLNLTYAELSRHLAGAGRTIGVLGLSRIEKYERRIDVDDLLALAFVFGVSPSDLLQPSCSTCLGSPPPGFTCNECGTAGK